MKICTKCEKENLDKSKFCQECGATLENNNTKNLVIIFCVLLIFAIGVPAIKGLMYKNDLYNEIITDVDNKNWQSAKSKLDELGDYKNISEYSSNINYQYYLSQADEQYKNKDYKSALSNYENAQKYNSDDKNLQVKITNSQKELKKQEEEIRKANELKKKQAEQAKLKAEREEKLKTQRMLNNVVILSQRFGYTQYGEEGVVGKIKNNNAFTVQVRADIDLKDSRGNIVGTTYTYDRIAPNSVWNFEAPTFGVSAHHTYLNLTIERVD